MSRSSASSSSGTPMPAAAAWTWTWSSWTSAPARPPSGSEADLQAGAAGELLGKPGGVFVLAADELPADDAVLLAAAARAVLGGGRGSLAEQLDRRPAAAPSPPPLVTSRPIATEAAAEPATAPEGLALLERPRRVHARTAAST